MRHAAAAIRESIVNFGSKQECGFSEAQVNRNAAKYMFKRRNFARRFRRSALLYIIAGSNAHRRTESWISCLATITHVRTPDESRVTQIGNLCQTAEDILDDRIP